MKRFVVLLMALALGCAARRPMPAPSVKKPPAAPKVIPGQIEASLILGDLPVRASKAGAGPMSVVTAGALAEGERAGAFIDVSGDTCLLVYARASTSVEDIDVALFTEEGTPVAVDESPDPRPTLLFCPGMPQRVYALVHVANGEGWVAVGSQLVAREQAQDVGKSVGAKGGLVGSKRSAEAWPGLDEAVRLHREAVGGKWQDIRRLAVTVDTQVPSYVSFSVDADTCTDILAIPGEDVDRLDLEIADGEGRLLARSRDGVGTRSITFCSGSAFNGTLSVRPRIGRGLAAVVLSRARGDVARDVGLRSDATWLDPGATLDGASNTVHSTLSGAGYGAARVAHRGQLRFGAVSSVNLPPRGAGCTRVDIIGGAPVAVIDATLWDEKGKLVAAAEGAFGVSLFACAPGRLRLDVEPKGRPGPFAVQLREEVWKDPVFSTQPLAAGRMLARAAKGLPKVHDGTSLGARALTLDAATRAHWEREIPAASCLDVSVGAQGEGTGIDARAWDVASGEELDRAHASSSVALHACATNEAARSIRVELRATSGKLEAIVGERLVR